MPRAFDARIGMWKIQGQQMPVQHFRIAIQGIPKSMLTKNANAQSAGKSRKSSVLSAFFPITPEQPRFLYTLEF